MCYISTFLSVAVSVMAISLPGQEDLYNNGFPIKKTLISFLILHRATATMFSTVYWRLRQSGHLQRIPADNLTYSLEDEDVLLQLFEDAPTT